MEGVAELAEEIFHMPVRLAVPQYVSGLIDVIRNPIHATGVGLLLFGLRHHGETATRFSGDDGLSVWQRMKRWFQGNF